MPIFTALLTVRSQDHGEEIVRLLILLIALNVGNKIRFTIFTLIWYIFIELLSLALLFLENKRIPTSFYIGYGFIPPPTSASVTNSNANDPNGRYKYGTFVNPYALGCFKCPTCDIDKNSTDCMCEAKSLCGPLWTKLRTGNSFTDNPNKVRMAPPSYEQIQGDFGDIAGSPNDPIFVFHHGNVDRIFESWSKFYTSSSGRENYYNFPKSGFAQGCNLDDIISSTNPFRNLESDSSNNPYTVKDLFDKFSFPNTPYTYDSIRMVRNQRPLLRLEEGNLLPHEFHPQLLPPIRKNYPNGINQVDSPVSKNISLFEMHKMEEKKKNEKQGEIEILSLQPVSESKSSNIPPSDKPCGNEEVHNFLTKEHQLRSYTKDDLLIKLSKHTTKEISDTDKLNTEKVVSGQSRNLRILSPCIVEDNETSKKEKKNKLINRTGNRLEYASIYSEADNNIDKNNEEEKVDNNESNHIEIFKNLRSHFPSSILKVPTEPAVMLQSNSYTRLKRSTGKNAFLQDDYNKGLMAVIFLFSGLLFVGYFLRKFLYEKSVVKKEIEIIENHIDPNLSINITRNKQRQQCETVTPDIIPEMNCIDRVGLRCRTPRTPQTPQGTGFSPVSPLSVDITHKNNMRSTVSPSAE